MGRAIAAATGAGIAGVAAALAVRERGVVLEAAARFGAVFVFAPATGLVDCGAGDFRPAVTLDLGFLAPDFAVVTFAARTFGAAFLGAVLAVRVGAFFFFAAGVLAFDVLGDVGRAALPGLADFPDFPFKPDFFARTAFAMTPLPFALRLDRMVLPAGDAKVRCQSSRILNRAANS